MRLIKTSNYELVEFNPPSIPPYAILSHTWGDDEYLFTDRNEPARRDSAGFEKIIRCCAIAAGEGYNYVWIDTCCIDKTSSAELSESINSMYRWYREAQVCYVYLADFSLTESQDGNGTPFRSSRWFTRGWTLQELLAPKYVIFYDRDWIEIGSKVFLRGELSEICRISEDHIWKPQDASVATKMSWASRRETSREEDIAYCLLGLFRVNMPLLYGEGKNAFYRLQCEIIHSSPDESIFAWMDPNLSYGGLLAREPRAFEGSNEVVPVQLRDRIRKPYFIVNRGLSIELLSQPQPPYKTAEEDFERELAAAGDPRVGGRSMKAEIGSFSTTIACARASDEGAPLVLFFRSINGIFASRIKCDRMTFDHGPLHQNESQLHKQIWLVGQHCDRERTLLSRHYIRPEDPVMILTPAARGVFIVKEKEFRSTKPVDVREDGSLKLAGGPKELIFSNFMGCNFTVKWDIYSVLLITIYTSPHPTRRQAKYMGDIARFCKPLLSKTLSRSDDYSIVPIDDGSFLWIKLRRQMVEDHASRSAFIVDVTTIDRSKALGRVHYTTMDSVVPDPNMALGD